MDTKTPTIEVKPEGIKLPVLGLGTSRTKGDDVYSAITTAIDLGYRHFDCAFIYGNEDVIGDALKAKMDEGVVKREDLFITTKLWITFNRPEHMHECFDESLRRLKLDYIDLYLLHAPHAWQYCGMDPFTHISNPDVDMGAVALNSNPVNDEDMDYVNTWNAMQKFKSSGRAKLLGVSNLNEFQLKRLLRESSHKPSINQIESHPYFNQDSLINVCHSNGIMVIGHCSIGSPGRPNVKKRGPFVLENPILKRFAETRGKTPAQIALRFSIQRGLVVIPRSVNPSRIEENMNVFDFTLTDEEMREIYSLERGQRLCLFDKFIKHKYHPFRENYSE